MTNLNKKLYLDPVLFTTKIKKIPTRDGYGTGVIELGKKNREIVVLCCDLTESTRNNWFKEKFPNRFIEVGVAEQNMMGIAAGMAMVGKIPFASSYAVFSPGRNWDQLRVSVCYNNANVKIVGAHAGISVGPDGATHQALEDIAIVRVLPNMTVVVPCDAPQANKATIAIGKHKGPAYIRLGREKTPVMTTNKTPFTIGKIQVFSEGKDVTIIAAGSVLYNALEAAQKLFKKRISCTVINCHTIKPLDEKGLYSAIKKTGRVVTVEEHQIYGGLGSAISEFCAKKIPVPIEMVGVNNLFGESGESDELIKKYHIATDDIVRAVHNVLKR
jgi:transketolase